MPEVLEKTELRRLAESGAATRLIELERERHAILAAFPNLRHGRSIGVERNSTPVGTPARRRRRGMSAAARKAVSLRMKRYWANRRKQAAR